MKTSLKLASALFAATLAAAAAAKPSPPPPPPPPPIPTYQHVGSINTKTYTFEAVATGEIDAYFLSGSADYTEVLGMEVNGVKEPAQFVGLPNHGTAVGTKLDLGSVKAGDIVTFYINVQSPKMTWYSNPKLNSDNMNHVFSTGFAGGIYNKVDIPASVLLAFEDQPKGKSDYDYNDAVYAITDVKAIPEPDSLALLVAGLGIVGAVARRRRA